MTKTWTTHRNRTRDEELSKSRHWVLGVEGVNMRIKEELVRLIVCQSHATIAIIVECDAVSWKPLMGFRTTLKTL